MSDTATLQSAALLENEHVKELLAILKENRVSTRIYECHQLCGGHGTPTGYGGKRADRHAPELSSCGSAIPSVRIAMQKAIVPWKKRLRKRERAWSP